MALGCKIGTKTIRFDDLTPAAWQSIQDNCSANSWSDLYLAPLSNLNGAILVVTECVKVAEPDADAMARANELGPTLGALSKLFVEVDDDMPHQFEDGIPKEEDGDSTPRKSSS